MWRRLLDIAEPNLKTNAKTAEKLLLDWDWLESPTDDQALPLLVALDDERFVSQLFESAFLDRLQFSVLEICRDCGEETLARHCMDLALKNPCLDEQWRKRYTQVLAAAPSSKRTKPPARALARPPVSTPAKPAGESYYQFCNVQFKEDGVTYAYLTGGNFAESRRFCSRSDRRSSSRKACSGDRGVRLQHTECAISAGEGEICAPQV